MLGEILELLAHRKRLARHGDGVSDEALSANERARQDRKAQRRTNKRWQNHARAVATREALEDIAEGNMWYAIVRALRHKSKRRKRKKR